MQAESLTDKRNKSLKIMGRGGNYRDLLTSMCRTAQPIRRWHEDEQRQRLRIDETVSRLAR